MESTMIRADVYHYFRPSKDLSEERNNELNRNNELLLKALMYEDVKCIRKYNDMDRLWTLGEIAIRIYENECNQLSELEIRNVIKYLDSSEKGAEKLGGIQGDRLVDYMFEVAKQCVEQNNHSNSMRCYQDSKCGESTYKASRPKFS